MENFHHSFQYTKSNLSAFIEFILIQQSFKHFLQLNIKMKLLIDKNFKINAQVCINFLADLNVDVFLC